MTRLPTFAIIGAQKSGTSALASYLAQHPAVFIPTGKEMHFFDTEPRYGSPADYAQLFRGAQGAPHVGEATPNYLYFPEVPKRMASVIPQAKVIAILRNPVDRAYSQYWMNRSRGIEPLEFRDALAQETERLSSGDPDARRAFSYLERGRYDRQLQRYEVWYPPEQTLILLFEDLRDDVERTYQAVCRFIGVDDSFVPSNLGRRVTPHVRFRSLALRRFAQRHLSKRAYDLIGRVNARPADYPPMDAGLRAELQALFASDNQRLADRIGRDLSAWTSQTSAAGASTSQRSPF